VEISLATCHERRSTPASLFDKNKHMQGSSICSLRQFSQLSSAKTIVLIDFPLQLLLVPVSIIALFTRARPPQQSVPVFRERPLLINLEIILL